MTQGNQKTFLIIYNERSGVVYANHRKIIINFLSKHKLQAIFHNTTPDGSFAKYQPNDFQRIIVAGGDGTIKEVANWIIKNNSQTPLAIIPRGSGNVLAQSLGIPLNAQKAIEIAITGEVQKIDAGLINKREHFLLMAGMGFDAKVMKNTSPQLKRLTGFFAYVIATLKSFFQLQPTKIFLKSKEVQGTVRVQSILVSNISNLLNFQLSPQAIPNDGFLHVSLFRPKNLWQFLQIFLKILIGGDSKNIKHSYFKTKSIYLLPMKKNTPMQIDGEVVDLPYMDIEIVPQAINIVTNKKL